MNKTTNKININDYIDTTSNSGKLYNYNNVHYAKYGTTTISEFLTNICYQNKYYKMDTTKIDKILDMCRNVKNYTLVNNYILCTQQKYIKIKNDKQNDYVLNTKYWLVDLNKLTTSDKIDTFSTVKNSQFYKTHENGAKFIELYNNDFAGELEKVKNFKNTLKNSKVNDLLSVCSPKNK